MVCSIVAGTGIIISNLHAGALANAERELRNIALVLSEQTARSFEGLELVQSGLIDRMSKFGIASAAELRERMAGYDAHVLLKDTVNGLPHLESVALFDASGAVVNFSRAWPVPAFNIAEREYFKVLASNRQLTSVLSEPILNRTTGTWSIYLARAFYAPNGELIGVIVGGMERRYFERYFAGIALEPSGAISLLRRDGLILAGHPQQRAADDALIGTALKTLLAQSDGGFARIADANGAERLVAAHAVAHYPMAVSVSTSVAAVLADWKSQAIYLGTAAMLVAFVIGGTTFVGIRQFHAYAVLARERAERTISAINHKATELVLRETERTHKLLSKQKVQLDTVLENMSQGVIMLDADARMLVCNNRYIEMYGMSPEVVTPGCTLHRLIEHRAEIGMITGDIDDIVRQIMSAIAKSAPSKMLTKLADGRVISVSTQPMAEGGWVATHQDVTDQRRAEREADKAQIFLLTVIENIPSTIVVKDARDLKYVLINRAGEKFYGLPRSDVIGRTSHDLFPKISADLIVAHDEALLRSGGEIRLDPHAIETPGNGRRLVVARRLAVRDENGKPQFLLSIIEDITGHGKTS
jgi:PAS domain S-box-containing protein